jgi:hypothetical protein
MRIDSGPPQGTTARRTGHTATPERVWWNSSLNRLARTPSIDPAEFDRASHDEARGASSRVWRVSGGHLGGGVRSHVSARCSPLPSRVSVVTARRRSQVRQSPAPALPPAPPRESPCPPRAPPHGPVNHGSPSPPEATFGSAARPPPTTSSKWLCRHISSPPHRYSPSGGCRPPLGRRGAPVARTSARFDVATARRAPPDRTG